MKKNPSWLLWLVDTKRVKSLLVAVRLRSLYCVRHSLSLLYIMNSWWHYFNINLQTQLIGASLSEPHINVKFVRLVCLSVCLSFCLSVRTFITRKYTRTVVIYGVPLVVDSSVYGAFSELLCMPMFNKHVATNNKNKQVPILRKQVYRSLIKIISLALLLLLKH